MIGADNLALILGIETHRQRRRIHEMPLVLPQQQE